jgi:hypothetical protein
MSFCLSSLFVSRRVEETGTSKAGGEKGFRCRLVTWVPTPNSGAEQDLSGPGASGDGKMVELQMAS